MFRINLKIALRNLLKHKTASLINISGLGDRISSQFDAAVVRSVPVEL